MKTSRPFSTISYNTREKLDFVLGDLIRRRVIDFYSWIEHHPEDDETKAHKHLWIVPNGKVDTDQVLDLLVEVDLSDPLKPPLKCLRARSSRFSDWYLYATHNKGYLLSKGQKRKYHYDRSDFVVSDDDYFLEEIHQVDHSKYTRVNALIDAVDNHTPFKELIKTGTIPIQQIVAYEKAYYLISDTYPDLERGGRPGHDVDNETGEVY